MTTYSEFTFYNTNSGSPLLYGVEQKPYGLPEAFFPDSENGPFVSPCGNFTQGFNFTSIGHFLSLDKSTNLRDVAQRYFPQAGNYIQHLFTGSFNLALTMGTTVEVIPRVNHLFEVINGWKSKDDPIVGFFKMDAYATMCYMLTIAHGNYTRTVDEDIASVAARGHDGWSMAMLMYLDEKLAECSTQEKRDALIAKRASQFVPFAELTPEAQQLDIMIIQITDAIVKGKSDVEIISLF